MGTGAFNEDDFQNSKKSAGNKRNLVDTYISSSSSPGLTNAFSEVYGTNSTPDNSQNGRIENSE